MGLFLVFLTPITIASSQPAALKTLIVTGQNNHNWKISSPILKQILEDTGLFQVDIATSPAQGENMASFIPDFSAYQLVVLDYNGDEWPQATKKSFLEFVRNGGGVVVYHAADNAFPKWQEFNRIIGLGGWGNRDEKSGPYVFWKDGQAVRDTGPGIGGYHGDQHAFPIINRDLSHPITRGLPERWMHARDELYSLLRGPAENLHILATAYNDPKIRGTGRHEPVLFTITYGKGRIFHTVLGHAMGESPPPAMQCVGFIVTLQRGSEWAATGEVTQQIPGDFPALLRDTATPDDVRKWTDFRPPSLKKILDSVSSYRYGQSEEPLAILRDYIRAYRNSPESRKICEQELLAFLQSDASLAGKSAVCRHLREIGTSASVPGLEKMLLQPETSDPARYALEKIPGAAAEEALIRGLSASQGKSRIRLGIIASLGNRRAKGAVPFLEKGLYAKQRGIPAACIKAMGQIASEGAITALLKALDGVSDPLKSQAASALLLCMDRYLLKTDQEAAAKIYYRLVGAKLPLPIRQAAMRGQIAASGKRAPAIIVNALKGNDMAWHVPAIAMVKYCFDDSNISEICKLLPRLPTASQVQLLAVLPQYQHKDVLAAVILSITENKDLSVRIAALKTLGKVGHNPQVVELLLLHAAQTRGEEQMTARSSLWGLQYTGVNPVILTNLVKQPDPAVQYELLLCVGERSIAEGLNLLLMKTRSSPVMKNRLQAIKSLKSIASASDLPRLVRILLELKGEREQLEMASTIAGVAATDRTRSIGRARVVMDKLIEVKDIKERGILLRTLGKIGDDSSLSFIRPALSHESPELRDAAVRALSEWPTATPKEDLLNIAQASTEPTHKILALRAYIRMVGMEPYKSPALVVKSLKEVLDLSRPEEKKLVLGILPVFASDEALQLAESLAADTAVAAEARMASDKIRKKLEK